MPRWRRKRLSNNEHLAGGFSRDLIKPVYSEFPLPRIFPRHAFEFFRTINYTWYIVHIPADSIILKVVYANFGWLSREHHKHSFSCAFLRTATLYTFLQLLSFVHTGVMTLRDCESAKHIYSAVVCAITCVWFTNYRISWGCSNRRSMQPLAIATVSLTCMCKTVGHEVDSADTRTLLPRENGAFAVTETLHRKINSKF